MTRATWMWLALALVAGGLVVHALRFDFVNDDAYISFVYARNFAEHGELVFNLGDRVEGYTNFLWTVLLGVLMRLGAQPEVTSRLFGVLFGIATLVVVFRFTARLRGRAAPLDLLAPALLAASAGYACWCMGGLETQMFTFFTVLAITSYLGESWVLSGVAFALAAMARPEGVLVFAVCGLHRLACNLLVDHRLVPTKGELLWVAGFVGLYAPYFAWRWAYYGHLFPNTAYVKAGGEPPPGYAKKMLESGVYYVWQWAWQSRAVFAIPFAVLAVIRRPRAGALLWMIIIVYLVYTVRVGGDFMGLHRFVMPLFVCVALFVAIGVELIPKVHLPIAAVLLVGFAVSQVPVGTRALEPKADNGIDRPGYLALYAHDRALIGKALAPIITPEDFSVVGGAGVQPYYARMRAIDIFGLVSEDIAHNEPPRRPRPGHQKWGSPERILKYDPDFLFYCYDLHHDPKRYRLCGEAGFFQKRGYEPVTMHIPGMKERGEYYTFLKKKDRPWPDR